MKTVFVALFLLPLSLYAQRPQTDLSGSWRAETPDGPQTIVVRSDSTVSIGEETVRWRVHADTIFVLFGEEWLGYNFEIRGDTLTLSGGDLMDPVVLVRVGPPAPMPQREAALAHRCRIDGGAGGWT